MNQTRTLSLVEAIVNILVGFPINWMANLYVLPLFGFYPTGGQAFWIGVLFTAISLVRGYSIRRFFNSYLHRFSAWVAAGINRLAVRFSR